METKSRISTSNKIVVVGSCSVDFTTYASRLPMPGETIHGNKFTTSYGGKGANQCVAAAKLGGNAYIIGRLGNDQWGERYKQYLQEVGVDVTHLNITPNAATGIAQISVAENGENQIVIVTGANNMLSKADIETSAELIKSADVLIGQLETPFESTLAAFQINAGIKLLNAAPALTGIKKILPYCTILCVNESEASLLTNIDVNISNAVDAIKIMLSSGCGSVIITLGSEGAIYMSKEEMKPIHVMCNQVVPVDTTGAGDAFVGALATFLVTHKSQPIHQIIGAACYVATVSVTKEGTQTSYPSNLTVFDREYKFKTI